MLYHYCIVLLEVIDIDLLYILLSMYLKCSVQVSLSVVSDSFRPHESQHARPPCPSPTPGVHSDSCPSSQWCHPAISSSVVPFSSCPQSLPASESFPMSQFVRCDMKNSYIKWILEIKMLWDFPGKCTGMGSHFLFQYI